MDYKKTFVHITKMTTIRTLIVVASVSQWNISQLNIKNTFLNEDLQKEFYMVPLLGVSHDSRYVCKLKKTLYDLKQTPRAWFEKCYVMISSLGFVFKSHDYDLFVISYHFVFIYWWHDYYWWWYWWYFSFEDIVS